jgi:hypothetical protein
MSLASLKVVDLKDPKAKQMNKMQALSVYEVILNNQICFFIYLFTCFFV